MLQLQFDTWNLTSFPALENLALRWPHGNHQAKIATKIAGIPTPKPTPIAILSEVEYLPPELEVVLGELVPVLVTAAFGSVVEPVSLVSSKYTMYLYDEYLSLTAWWHSCSSLRNILGSRGRHVDREALGWTVIDVDTTRARDIDRGVSDGTTTFNTGGKKWFSDWLKVGPAIAVIGSKAARSKTAHVVIYTTQSIANHVLETAAYWAGGETGLCAWFLGGKNVKAEDCLW